MPPEIIVREAKPRILAAVRRRVRLGEVAGAWKPALDEVWAFLGQHRDLRADGHNVFLYHHPARREDPMDVDFGVEVIREFPPAGDVRAVRTPMGRVASARHVGRYDDLKRTHDAIHAWAAREGIAIGGASWEIYGDPTPDPSKNEVTIEYLIS